MGTQDMFVKCKINFQILKGSSEDLFGAASL